MRGFNQRKESTSSNPQDSFLTKDIEDYTIKDCEDFLAKYPKDIDADKVRKKLEQLKPKKITEGKTNSVFGKDKPKEKENVQRGKNENSELYIIKAVIPGTIVKIQTRIGVVVRKNDSLFEALMLSSKQKVKSGVNGVVEEILVKEGEYVEEGTPLAKINLKPKIKDDLKDVFWAFIGLIILLFATWVGCYLIEGYKIIYKIVGGFIFLLCGGLSLITFACLLLTLWQILKKLTLK